MNTTEPFIGAFRILRPVMISGRRAEPGETVRINDPWTARDLLDAGRVECSSATLAALIEATNRPPALAVTHPRMTAAGVYILPTRLAGLVRRVARFGDKG